MKKVDVSKLKIAIAAGEEHLSKLGNPKKKKDKKHIKRVDTALEKGYALLNSKPTSQRKVNRVTYNIWHKVLNKKPWLLYLSNFLTILLALALIFTSYETYSFIKTYWDKIKDIRVVPGDNEESDISSESSTSEKENSSSKKESKSSTKESKSSKVESSSAQEKDESQNEESTSDDVDKIIVVNYNESKIVNLEKLSPVTDENGLKNTAQEIDIYNDNNTMPDVDYTVNYNINIKELNDGKTNLIDARYIKYKYYKTDKYGNKTESQIGRLSDLEVRPDGTYKFITSSQKANGHDYYKIVFWISSEAENDQQNKTYTLSFQATATVSVD